MAMNKKTWLLIAALLLYALGALSGVFIHRAWTKPDIQQIDTTTVTRTAELDSLPQTIVSQPAPADTPPVIVPSERVEIDTADSSCVRIFPDIVSVSGSLTNGLTYHATLTGVQPSLQDLAVSYPEHTITQTVTKPYTGWMLSATADIGGYAAPQLTVATKVALEASYNTGPLHVGLQGGIMSIPTSGTWKPSPYIGARVTIDIIRF